MRVLRAWSAFVAGWVAVSFSISADAAVYKTPTRQKQPVRTAQKAKPVVRNAARTYAYAPNRQPAATQPAQSTRPVAKVPRENTRKPVARPSTSRYAYAPTQVARPAPKSNEMLALEALERAPVSAAQQPAPAAAKPAATPYRSADAAALDALMRN